MFHFALEMHKIFISIFHRADKVVNILYHLSTCSLWESVIIMYLHFQKLITCHKSSSQAWNYDILRLNKKGRVRRVREISFDREGGGGWGWKLQEALNLRLIFKITFLENWNWLMFCSTCQLYLEINNCNIPISYMNISREINKT